MKRFVIYTALIGDYDSIRQPLVVDDRFDYILFSDCLNVEQIGVWQVRKVDYYNDIQTKIARYVKTHPHTLLSEYKASVWIDASFLITSTYIYERTIELFSNNTLIAAHLHQDWTCTYQEMLGMMRNQWESEDVTLCWGHYLRKEQFPRGIGTWETGVLFRLHTNPLLSQFNDMWWHCIENYSRRDQYSFRYVLWRMQINCISFLPIGCDVRNQEHYKLMQHQNLSKHVSNNAPNSWILRYYLKHPEDRVYVENIYYWIYGRICPKLWAETIGQILRVKHLCGSFSRFLKVKAIGG